MTPLELTDYDRQFYAERIHDFLPERIVDCHTHIWTTDHLLPPDAAPPSRSAAWASSVAVVHPVEQLVATYAAVLDGKSVIPVVFPGIETNIDAAANNNYVTQSATAYGVPSLALTTPSMSAGEFETTIRSGGHHGCKPYLNFAPAYLPQDEIRIYDFLPPAHLDVLNANGWVAMLHIPRPGRLRDPVNLAQLREIDERYPNARVIIAHIGRAYTLHDVGDGMAAMSQTQNLLFDITANTNSDVMRLLIDAVGPSRILFGSDLPIFTMRAHRIVEGDQYVNVVPRGKYHIAPNDPTMRETDSAETITLLLYEQIDAFRRAATAAGLSRTEIQRVFHDNAAHLFGLASTAAEPAIQTQEEGESR
ncbi:amidohydrolase family protein [Mycolicibacterium komossense]|uniref:Amidohydrolase family protein n=1 Tax=Mycolicibacterium komossense TaxID=1779 RepID=A0ABT3C6Q8_9MYCO|nr:amidohydrolase [Mycolicibacterium komossense]MCV7225138.1 amidohydrolase family protein [Mycolicibacterium komossense]